MNDACAQRYPNLFIQKYLDIFSRFGTPTSNVILSSAFKAQELSCFIRMPELASNWTAEYSGLKSLIPSVLSASISGYSFIIPDIVGGGSNGGRASPELYIRWLQATCFMPTIAFSIPPWDYESPKVLELSRKFINLHILHSGIILKLAKRRVQYGEPIIRPMWFEAPEDERSFGIQDQFMLGPDILVAPVVDLNQSERRVYLPSGNWIDQHGNIRSGAGFITVSAPLEELPYFKRQFEV